MRVLSEWNGLSLTSPRVRSGEADGPWCFTLKRFRYKAFPMSPPGLFTEFTATLRSIWLLEIGIWSLFGICLPASPSVGTGAGRQGICDMRSLTLCPMQLLKNCFYGKAAGNAGTDNTMRRSGIVTDFKEAWDRSLIGRS